MKETYLFISCLMVSMGLAFGQKEPVADTVLEAFLPEMLYVENKSIGDVTDMVYWKGECYLIDKSFLSMLKGHKNLYKSIPLEVTIVIQSYITGSTTEKNYIPLWLLRDGRLYLRDIKFFIHPSNYYKPQGEYRLMQRLTKHKFRKSSSSFAQLEPKESVVGSMFASWVNGIFLVKKARLPEDTNTLKAWFKNPYYQLVFKNGRLISIDTIRPFIPEPEKLKIPIIDNPIKLY